MNGLLERLRRVVGMGTTSVQPDEPPPQIIHFSYGGWPLCGAHGVIKWASQLLGVTCKECREKYQLLHIKAHVSER